MKSRLTTLDIVVLINELRQKLVGLRVDQIYDIDKKTYLIRLVKSPVKMVLLIESGARFHTTGFEWPKNPAPSGFTMKLRKHLSNKRLESISQVGADRVIDFQFGTDAFTFHLVLELYDKGNVVLTDGSYNILSLVRPHVQGEERMLTKETYSTERAKQNLSLTFEEMQRILVENPKKTIRETILSKIEFGPTLLSFVLKKEGLAMSTKIPEETADEFQEFEKKLFSSLEQGRKILENPTLEGGFILKSSQSTNPKGLKLSLPQPVESLLSKEQPIIYDQFHPNVLKDDFPIQNVIEFPTLNEAVDDFFSKIEAQKVDLKQMNQEREALKKLERVKEDQQKRLQELKDVQEVDKKKAELIMFNQELIESAITVIRTLIANQIPWDEIWQQIKDAQSKGDGLATRIVSLNLIRNQFTILLRDPYDEDPESTANPESDNTHLKVEIDLDLSAYGNASKFFDLKKASARKEERTLDSQAKAFKSTEKKTMSSLREVATIQLIKKARKVLWFEKFHWFISSENYIVLGGHDAQQNELLVKRYMGAKDIYLHADAHGAPTIIIKNDNAPAEVPPKTLNEAGCLAVCSSGSWETKIVASAWWVWGEQVSKSAPTGEYLPTGSFMIRGKKNYIPQSQLILGFGFMFRLTDESIPRHRNERSRRVGKSPEKDELSFQSQSKDDHEEDPPQLDSASDEEETPEFPDTKVELNVNNVPSNPRGMSEKGDDDNENTTIIKSGILPNISVTANKQGQNKKKGGKVVKEPPKETEEKPEERNENTADPNSTANRSKRGQHGRKKKLKEKYKFQDDEERELRMKLLQKKEGVQDSQDSGQINESRNSKLGSSSQHNPPQKAHLVKKADGAELKVPEDSKLDSRAGVDDEPQGQWMESLETGENFLNSLTGCPLEEDELLYAIPVVAPYATLQNYKYKIKMLPGTAKRGKAARTALESFLRNKQGTPREKDLLKSVKDQDLAKNFPGKVKLAGGADSKK